MEPMTPSFSNRWQRTWTAMGFGFVGLVWYLSLTRLPSDLHVGVDLDLGHIVAYFWLMIWFAQLYRSTSARLELAAGFFAMGVALEFLQGATGYRQFDPADMLRNLTGLLLGLLMARTPLQNALRSIECRVAARQSSVP